MSEGSPLIWFASRCRDHQPRAIRILFQTPDAALYSSRYAGARKPLSQTNRTECAIFRTPHLMFSRFSRNRVSLHSRSLVYFLRSSRFATKKRGPDFELNATECANAHTEQLDSQMAVFWDFSRRPKRPLIWGIFWGKSWTSAQKETVRPDAPSDESITTHSRLTSRCCLCSDPIANSFIAYL